MEYEVTQKPKKGAGKTMEAVKEQIGIPSVHGLNRQCLKAVEKEEEQISVSEKNTHNDQESHGCVRGSEGKVEKYQRVSCELGEQMGGGSTSIVTFPIQRYATRFM